MFLRTLFFMFVSVFLLTGSVAILYLFAFVACIIDITTLLTAIGTYRHYILIFIRRTHVLQFIIHLTYPVIICCTINLLIIATLSDGLIILFIIQI